MIKGPMIEVEVRASNGQNYKEWVDADRIVAVLTAFNPPGEGSSIPTPMLSGCQLQLEGGVGFTAVMGKRELGKHINSVRRAWYQSVLGQGGVLVETAPAFAEPTPIVFR